MRVFCATLVHESSRWSPIPTDITSFSEDCLYLPSTGEGAALRGQTIIGVNWDELLSGRGHKPCFGLLASAEPSRPASASAYERLKQELLSNLAACDKPDCVALFIHGAQVAEGINDVTADILRGVRDIVGPETPVGVLFDLHGNISDEAISLADVLISCLEYPHTDFGSRADQLVGILESVVAGHIGTHLARRRVPMLGTYFTTSEPMRSFVDWAKAFEGSDGILAVSISHGFAWADVEACGASVLVCGQEGDAAGALADRISERFFALRDEIRTPLTSAEEAVRKALSIDAAPIIIADISDNPGGGAPGDSTFLLRALLDVGARDCAVGMLWDPGAVATAMRAGAGTRIPLRIGGKASAVSGLPVDLEVEVLCCSEDEIQVTQGMPTRIGPAAVVEAQGIKIVLCAVRQQVFDTACFESFGVRLSEQRVVVVKSHQHFREKFGSIAADILYATPPGAVNTDYKSLNFQNIPRPFYPKDEPPFEAFGRSWS